MAAVSVNASRQFRSIRYVSANRVDFELYLREINTIDDTRHLPLHSSTISLEAFSYWRDGSSGAATITEASPDIQASAGSGAFSHVFIKISASLTDLKKYNDADTFKFSYQGDDFTISITDPHYIQESTPRNFVDRSFMQYTLNSLASATVAEISPSQVRITVNHGFPVSVASLYIRDITGLVNKRGADFPLLITGTNQDFTTNGNSAQSGALTVKFAIGGATAGNEIDLVVSITRLASGVPDIPITNDTEFNVEITDVQQEVFGEATVSYTITPTPVAGADRSIRLYTTPVNPAGSRLSFPSTSNLARTSLSQAGLVRGTTYSMIVEYRHSSSQRFRSSPYYIIQRDTLRKQTDAEHLQEQLRTGKIYMTEITHNKMQWDIISDVFLGNYVNALKYTITPDNGDQFKSVDNMMDKAKISITIPSLTANTVYQIRFIAETLYGDVELYYTQMRSGRDITSETDTVELEAESVERILCMAYPTDILTLVQNLSAADKARLAVDAVQRLNSPQNDGYVHNMNRRPARGSVFASDQADITRTQFTQAIDDDLGNILENIPDIDEGGP